MNEDDLIQALLDAIASGNDEQTETAAQACTGHASLLPALRPLLSDPAADRRWWAVRTVALVGGHDAGRLLVERLADSDPATRCAAALGLGQLRYTAAVSGLIEQLADVDGWVRDTAADGLALIGLAAAPALAGAMGDKRDGVRVRAASALRRIVLAAAPLPPGLEPASVLGQTIGALFQGLQDRNYLVCQHSRDVLEQLGLLDNLIVM